MFKLILTAAAAAIWATTGLAGEAVSYTAGSGSFEGYYAAAQQPRGTVVILPTWNGISDYEKDRAQMLAAEGYNAFAADLHGAGARPGTMEQKQAAHDRLFADRDRLNGILRAAVETADRLGGGSLVVMGYSMGGGAVMELARSGLGSELGIDGYAIFSGRVSDPGGRMLPEDMAPVFVAHGELDHRIPASGLVAFEDDLDLAGIKHKILVYKGRGHLFSAFGFPNYDAEADRASWEEFRVFLNGLPTG